MAAETIAVVGESGSGKSSSLRNLDPSKTFIIATVPKPLPFRSWKSKFKQITVDKETNSYIGNYYVNSNWEKILNMLKYVNTKMSHIKYIVLDDMQYILSYEFVDRASEVGYSKFTELAQHLMEILRYSEKMRDDLKLIFLTHCENVGDVLNPKYVIKTIGKLLSEKVTLEGLFTYILFTKVQEGDDGRMEYKFITNTDGSCIAKTPMGMFEELLIDNDLNKVIKAIDEYNEGE